MALVVDGLVVRRREPIVGTRLPKARWVIHRADCRFAGGCQPLTEFAAEVTEAGVLHRVRLGLIAQCRSCAPRITR